MSGALQDALRERLSLESVATTALLAWLFHAVFGASLLQTGAVVVMTAVVGAGDVVADAYDVRESVAHGWTGALTFAGTGLLYALGDRPPLWFLGVFATIGAWFVLDAVQTARHEGVTETARDGREVYRDYVARRVHETLDERPRTRRELRDALDADDADVDAAVERLRERGAITEAGSELRVAGSEVGLLDRVGDRLAGFARRVARPVALEFRDAEAPTEGVDSTAEAGSADRATSGGEDRTGSGDATGVTDGSAATEDPGGRDEPDTNERELAGG